MASTTNISTICTALIRKRVDGVWWKQEVLYQSHDEDKFVWSSINAYIYSVAPGKYIEFRAMEMKCLFSIYLLVGLARLNHPVHEMATDQSYSTTVIHMCWILSQTWKHFVLWW